MTIFRPNVINVTAEISLVKYIDGYPECTPECIERRLKLRRINGMWIANIREVRNLLRRSGIRVDGHAISIVFDGTEILIPAHKSPGSI